MDAIVSLQLTENKRNASSNDLQASVNVFKHFA